MSPVQDALGALQLPDCHGQPTCDPRPPCPSCGGLECLCRPRFFAGQLLTDEDLTRLDHYIQAKNRLHNRFLHGWGVACGLEVVCGVCGPDYGHVLVKPGYALSPCGNDIVVCRTESIDVCDLISRCRPPLDDCHDLFAPPARRPNDEPNVAPDNLAANLPECGGTEDWVLAVCYKENPARGVAALRAQIPEPSCGCGCGGGSDCGCGGKGKATPSTQGGSGCGCGSHASKRKSPVAATRAVPEQCEPTVTCEGYRFVVYKAPTKNANQQDFGAAERRFLCCIAPLLREVPEPNVAGNGQQGQDWVIAFRDAVRDFIVDEGLYDCEIAEKLAAIAIPSVADKPLDVALNDLNQAALSIADVGALAMQKCYCSALLPACPDPSQNDCVPLATVTVGRGKCRVKRVCNIGPRKFLATIPNIEYWLTFITDADPLRQYLENICCRFEPGEWKQQGVDFFKHAGDEIRNRIRAKTKNVTPWTLFWGSVNAPAHKFTIEHMLLGALGARNARGERLATDEELAHPTEAVMFNQVLAPFMRAMAPAGGADDLSDLKRQLADLQSTLASQQRTIDKHQRTINELRRDR
jgi:hypothetical protein